MKRALVFLIGIILLLVSGCEKPVAAVGSTAMLPLVKIAADEFMKDNPDANVIVSGGGSFTGLSQVASGYVDIGNSDVPAPEDDPLYQGLVEHVIAYAPFAFVVHPEIDIDNIAHEDLVGILTGEITNWEEVGSTYDRQINLIHRPPSSGSRKVIQDILLGEERFTLNAAVMNSNGEVLQTVESLPGAIGYVDYSYLQNTRVKVLSYEGYEPSVENVINGDYPIFAKVRMYTLGRPQGEVKDFVDFILSPGFQQEFVEQVGFVPVAGMQ